MSPICLQSKSAGGNRKDVVLFPLPLTVADPTVVVTSVVGATVVVTVVVSPVLELSVVDPVPGAGVVVAFVSFAAEFAEFCGHSVAATHLLLFAWKNLPSAHSIVK